MKLLDAIDSLKVSTRGDIRSPHKPLFLLYALAKQARDSNAKFEFSKIRKDVQTLLKKFGRPVKSSSRVYYPFWRLQNDGIWKVCSDEEIRLTGQGDAYAPDLIKYNATGCFSAEIAREIRENPNLVPMAAQKLLDGHFPETLHREIRDELESMGLSWEMDYHKPSPKTKRDPKFRKKVLYAYKYSCAVCGFDLHLGDMPVALEAAHIKWHQNGGPDTEDNGLALCSTHHALLDSGALGLSDDYQIVLSKSAHSPSNRKNSIMEQKLRRRRITLPADERNYPNVKYIRWHRKEVFNEHKIAL